TPSIVLHVDWIRDRAITIIDSREIDYDSSIPDLCSQAPFWEISFPGRLRVELRTHAAVPFESASLETLSALLLPFLELSRRTDRLSRAMSLLEVALTPVLSRQNSDTSSEIVERVGRQINAPTAFYPAPSPAPEAGDGPAHIYHGPLSNHVSQHIFNSFGRLPGGPVQRAMQSPAGAAPVTRASSGQGESALRLNEMLSRLSLTDYITIRVVHHERTIGVIACVATTSTLATGQFSGDDIATVASAGFIAGWAIPLAEQQAHLRRSLLESEMLRHLVQVSFQHKDQDETLSIASGVARILFSADYVALGSVSSCGELLGFRHVSGNRTEAHQHVGYTFTSDTVRSWLQSPNLIILQNLDTNARIEPKQFPILSGEQLITVIIAPIELEDGNWMILLIGFRTKQLVTDDVSRFARSLSQTIAAAL
ncbi:MAG: hypothetical protein WKF81_14970, partial [Thermomicrobiales bacterium]